MSTPSAPGLTPSSLVFFGKLPENFNETHLRRFLRLKCSKLGAVQAVEKNLDLAPGLIVSFRSADEAALIARSLSGYPLFGCFIGTRVLSVQLVAEFYRRQEALEARRRRTLVLQRQQTHHLNFSPMSASDRHPDPCEFVSRTALPRGVADRPLQQKSEMTLRGNFHAVQAALGYKQTQRAALGCDRRTRVSSGVSVVYDIAVNSIKEKNATPLLAFLLNSTDPRVRPRISTRVLLAVLAFEPSPTKNEVILILINTGGASLLPERPMLTTSNPLDQAVACCDLSACETLISCGADFGPSLAQLWVAGGPYQPRFLFRASSRSILVEFLEGLGVVFDSDHDPSTLNLFTEASHQTGWR